MQIHVFIPVCWYFCWIFKCFHSLSPLKWILIVVFVFPYLFVASAFPQILTSPLWFTTSWSATNTSVTPGSVSITTITETSNSAPRTSINSGGKDADGHTRARAPLSWRWYYLTRKWLVSIVILLDPSLFFLSALSLTRTRTHNVHQSCLIKLPYSW